MAEAQIHMPTMGELAKGQYARLICGRRSKHYSPSWDDITCPECKSHAPAPPEPDPPKTRASIKPQFSLPITWLPLMTAATNYCCYGGRDSGKTYGGAFKLAKEGAERPLRIAVLRKHKESTYESIMQAIWEVIQMAGLDGFYRKYAETIEGKNGTVIMFLGIARNTDDIKGLESIDRFLIDEAHTLTHDEMLLLEPTMRRPGVQAIFIFNPTRRTDWVYERFVLNPDPKDVIMFGNYDKNPYLSDESKERIERHRKTEPQFAHMYLGQLKDDLNEQHIIPYQLAELCVEAFRVHRNFLYDVGRPEMGLDIAGQGAAFNATVLRAGPVIYGLDRFRSPEGVGQTAHKAHNLAFSEGAARITYDGGGLGQEIRPHLRRLGTAYSVIEELFGGKVKGPKRIYSDRSKNEQIFASRGGQMAFGLRNRALATQRLMDDEDVYWGHCLFIDPSLPDLQLFLGQLSQPVWEEDDRSRIKVDKMGTGHDSPDGYDGSVLAFARDSNAGLVAR